MNEITWRLHLFVSRIRLWIEKSRLRARQRRRIRELDDEFYGRKK